MADHRSTEREVIAERLGRAGCVAAHEEAGLLLAAAPAQGDDGFDPVTEALVRRREQGEPLAWITGTVEFCGRRHLVDPGVYVPRPRTEELARRAAVLLAPGGRAVDLCTGTGAIATHLRAEVSTATVLGVDLDPRAVRCARRNGVAAVRADLDRPLASGSFDVVTAVAPYVPTDALSVLPVDVLAYEPRRALDGGDDGLDLVRRVVGGARRLLRAEGWLLIEVGGGQDELLEPVVEAAGFDRFQPWHDDDGDLRGVALQRSGAPHPG